MAGYLVESKRGGGADRIGRIEFSSHHEMLRFALPIGSVGLQTVRCSALVLI